MLVRAYHAAACATAILALACANATRTPRPASAQLAIDELLAADRAFAAKPDGNDVVEKMTTMFADDVMMPTARGDLARNRAEAAEALRAELGAGRTRVVWAPIRGGISADGHHGFTFGYGTVSGPDTANVPIKYLAYWVKRPAGWRAAAYRIVRRAPGPVAATMMTPALPERWLEAAIDASTIESHRASLIAAERAFSDRAQLVGLGPAFAENGSADAVNMGGRDASSFVVGAAAIGQAVGGGSTATGSPVSWSADRALVASTGDLGVTFGIIRPNDAPPDRSRPAGFPFFTIWRRAGPAEPWKYIAE